MMALAAGAAEQVINPDELYVGAYVGKHEGPGPVPNMNGKYPGIANEPSPGSFPLQHRGEFFEVYGHPITNQYSEVFWTAQPSVPLPDEIVKRFDNKTMQITGFEVDIVRKLPNGKEEHVPSYQWYNHHYCVALKGKASEMVYVGRRTNTEGVTRRAIERNPPEFEPRAGNDPNPDSTVPSAQMFWQGNGGEHRLSFKHFPVGYGQQIESPQEFWLQPMLINTHGPDGETKHVSGPIPRMSYGGEPNQTVDRYYSPMMECPCTDRIKRVITGFTTTVVDTCGNLTVTNADECFEAAAQLTGVAGHGGGEVSANVTETDDTLPGGCYMMLHTSRGVESVEAHFNTATDSIIQCGEHDGRPIRSIGTSDSDVFFELDLDSKTGNATITLTGPVSVWFGIGFDAQQMNDDPYTITVEADGTVTERKLGNHVPGSVLKPSVEIVSTNTSTPADRVEQMNHYGAPFVASEATDWNGCQALCDANSTCMAWTYHPPHMDSPYDLVKSDCWLRFGLCSATGCQTGEGFTKYMWTPGMVSGQKQPQSRTVVLRRPFKGATPDHYTFKPTQSALNFIQAVGTTPAYSYHGKTRSGATLMMVEAGAPLCVCRAEHPGGSLNGLPFRQDCANFPLTTIERDHNPSCDIDTYMGGMKCCHHGVFLLDSDQAIPPKTDTVQMKWRFYFEEPKPTDQNAFFLFFETEANHGEYDVPKCQSGTPPAECVDTITARRQLMSSGRACHDRSDAWCAPSEGGNFPQTKYLKFLHISPHCHGPACISMELIDTDKNESICKVHPFYGTGDEPFNEAGYAAGILPCIWGSAAEGLEMPPVLPADTNVLAIKRANSTLKHYGVMGHWQMRAVWATEAEYREYRAYVAAKATKQRTVL